MKALSTFVDQLAENAAKQPGWVPLVILSYIAIPLTGFPASIQQWQLVCGWYRLAACSSA